MWSGEVWALTLGRWSSWATAPPRPVPSRPDPSRAVRIRIATTCWNLLGSAGWVFHLVSAGISRSRFGCCVVAGGAVWVAAGRWGRAGLDCCLGAGRVAAGLFGRAVLSCCLCVGIRAGVPVGHGAGGVLLRGARRGRDALRLRPVVALDPGDRVGRVVGLGRDRQEREVLLGVRVVLSALVAPPARDDEVVDGLGARAGVAVVVGPAQAAAAGAPVHDLAAIPAAVAVAQTPAPSGQGSSCRACAGAPTRSPPRCACGRTRGPPRSATAAAGRHAPPQSPAPCTRRTRPARAGGLPWPWIP
mgnify:CR=1 FL=1